MFSDSSAPKARPRSLAWFVSLAFGILCLIVWLFLPTTNLYRTTDLPTLFETALPIEDTVRPPETEPNTPIRITGKATFGRLPSDPGALSQGPFLAMKRHLEVYGWVEEEVPESELPPNPRRIDRYRYRTEWLVSPKPWREFKVWKDHKYTIPQAQSLTLYIERLQMGRLILPIEEATLFGWKSLPLDENRFSFLKSRIHDGQYFYEAQELLDSPRPGNVRLRYDVVELPDPTSVTLTVLASKDFNRITPFTMGNGQQVFYVVVGDESAMREALGSPPLPLGLARTLNVLFPTLALLAFLFSAFYWNRGRRSSR